MVENYIYYRSVFSCYLLCEILKVWDIAVTDITFARLVTVY